MTLAALVLAQAVATAPAPRELAKRVVVPGVENVALVAPGIYRGATPGEKGLDGLKALGIKTEAAAIAEELGRIG